MLHALILTAALGASFEQISAPVRGSLEATLMGATGKHGQALAAQAARLLRWKGDLIRNIHPNDRIIMVYDPDDEPQLLSMRYEGAEIQLHAYLHRAKDGVERYYDEKGVLIEPWLSKNPVEGYTQITETVQHGRGKRRHNGMDFKAPTGTPIHVPFAARVSRVNWRQRINGNCVEVVYPDGKIARFLHLDKVDPKVRPGASLSAGSSLGTVGNTGRSTAAHLHYEVLSQSGQPVDPLKYHGYSPRSLEDGEQATFRSIRDFYDSLMPLETSGPPI